MLKFEGKMDTAGRVVIFVLLFVKVCTEFENCNRHVSFGYGYKEFFALTKEIMHPSEYATVSFEFYVKTSSDAHVLLTNEVTGNESIEIVIGGGSNTFSQIRMIRYGDRKIILTERTENILSSAEYKKFHISIDKDDIIAVRVDENVFLNWKLVDLFPIKYVAFGSWTNTKAEWRFACDSHKALDKSMVPPPPMKRLKNHLLYTYDPNTLPVDPPNEIHIKIKLILNNFHMNEQFYLTVRGMALLEWNDNKLKWRPDDYEGIKNIFLPSFQIWTPYLTILDEPLSRNEPLVDMSTSGVQVTHEGSLFWRAPFKITYYCYINMSNWPIDPHDCTIRIGFENEPENLVLTFKETSSQIFKRDGIYEVSKVRVSNGEDCLNGCGVISVILISSSPIYLFQMITGFHVVVFVVLWFRLPHNILIYLFILICFVYNLYDMALNITSLPKDVPKCMKICVVNFIFALTTPLLYAIWMNIPTNIPLPLWVCRSIVFLSNAPQMNNRNRNTLFPMKKICRYIFMALHILLSFIILSLH